MPKRLTPLTDPDNLMVVWDEPEPAEETRRPAKKTTPRKRTS